MRQARTASALAGIVRTRADAAVVCDEIAGEGAGGPGQAVQKSADTHPSIPSFSGRIPGKPGKIGKRIRPVRAPYNRAHAHDARTQPIITDHRLTRFLTLVWLRLLRMAGRLMFGIAPFKDELNAVSRFVAAFIVIRAVSLADDAAPLSDDWRQL